jgi:hypothetical protein
VPKQTSYARVLSGEIPILIDFDFNAYRGKYKDHCDCAFVIPQEGSVVMPYVMALVKSDPHPADAKKVLDYLLSDAGQQVWANAFLRPVFAAPCPKDVAAEVPARKDYAARTPSTTRRWRQARRRRSTSVPERGPLTARRCRASRGMNRDAARLALLMAPAALVFCAFWLLPMARIAVLGATGPRGLAAYSAMSPTRAISSASCPRSRCRSRSPSRPCHLRHRRAVPRAQPFPGRGLLDRDADAAARFPGRGDRLHGHHAGGRQGLIGDVSQHLFGLRIVFAYSIAGLFAGYLYFSIPRVILTMIAAMEKLDPALEEAARSLGAGPWRVLRDVVIPALKPAHHLERRDLLRDVDGCVRHRVHAGHAHRRPAARHLHRLHLQREFRDGRGAVDRAGRDHLAGARARAHAGRGRRRRRRDEHVAKRAGRGCASACSSVVTLGMRFLMAPVLMSILAGVTRNYFIGIRSGLTLQWLAQVWELYRQTIYLSLQIALTCRRVDARASACPQRTCSRRAGAG